MSTVVLRSYVYVLRLKCCIYVLRMFGRLRVRKLDRRIAGSLDTRPRRVQFIGDAWNCELIVNYLQGVLGVRPAAYLVVFVEANELEDVFGACKACIGVLWGPSVRLAVCVCVCVCVFRLGAGESDASDWRG